MNAAGGPVGLFVAQQLQLQDLGRQLKREVKLPDVGVVLRKGRPAKVLDVAHECRAAVESMLEGVSDAPGDVAVAVGSRGIAELELLVRSTVEALRDRGWRPTIVPAMGSHGGATVQGQRELLAGYGIIESKVGAPIAATMDTVIVGEIGDMPVHFDRVAYEIGKVVAIARVKPHTDFRSPIESGPSKMLAIGLGKRRGAETIHERGIRGLQDLMPAAARLICDSKLVLGSVAVVEDEDHRLSSIVGLKPEEIGAAAEASLLEEARRLLPHIPFDALDVLVIEQIGKDISGPGMDTSVIGRMKVPGVPDNDRPQIKAIAALSLSDGSAGNGQGLGLADVITWPLLERVRFSDTYTNALTAGIAGGVERAKVPIVMPDDHAAIAAAVKATSGSDGRSSHLAWITNTLDCHLVGVSEVLFDEVRSRDGFEVVRPVGRLPLTDDGILQCLHSLVST